MPKLRVNGIEMFYVEMGPPDAEPLVMIMGWGGDHTAWAFQLPVFSQTYRVIAFDNRGAGQTDAPDAPYSVRGMADDTIGLMDALKVDRAHICGLSMGGLIAQELALAHPDRVRTLQLHVTLGRLDAWLRFRGESMAWMRALDQREPFTKMLLSWVLSPATFERKPELVQLLIARALDNPYPTTRVGFERQAQAMEGITTLARLSQLRMPTLITFGADDIMVPTRFGRELASHVPHAEVVEIPDAGHLHMIEQPEAFNEAVLGFLAKHRGS